MYPCYLYRRNVSPRLCFIERVTNPQNQKPDVAATEAFCVMLTKESEGIQIGTKLLALRIQSSNEPEALQALAVSILLVFLFEIITFQLL